MDDSTKITLQADAAQVEIGTWPDEPLRLQEASLDPLLLWAIQFRATDITLQTDRPVYIEVDGILYPVTRRNLDSADMVNILSRIYGPDALAKLASGRDLDLSYEVRLDRNTRYRYRVYSQPRPRFRTGDDAQPAQPATDDGRSWHRRAAHQ